MPKSVLDALEAKKNTDKKFAKKVGVSINRRADGSGTISSAFTQGRSKNVVVFHNTTMTPVQQRLLTKSLNGQITEGTWMDVGTKNTPTGTFFDACFTTDETGRVAKITGYELQQKLDILTGTLVDNK